MVDKHACQRKYASLGLLLIIIAALVVVPTALAVSDFKGIFNQKYDTKGTRIDSCTICHAGGSKLNDYGKALVDARIKKGSNETKVMQGLTSIEQADSDGDGFSNIVEINARFFPGNVSDHPVATPTATPIVTTTPTVTATPPFKEIAINDQLIKIFEDIYSYFMKLSLPKSLDNYYQNSKPETPSSEYVGDMFIMAGAFDGMIANIQEGDMANANKSYTVFAKEYKNISRKVQAWKGYFSIFAVKKLGTDMNMNANDSVISKDIAKIGATCEKCMGERRAQVWAKYYWRDFDTVNISGIAWKDAMIMLAVNFGGIGANAAEGNQAATNNSFNKFKASYAQVKTACYNCHDTPRAYYVSDDVFARIDLMGTNINANNMTNVQAIQRELGIQCYRCHVLHMPAQDMKSKMNRFSKDK